MVPKKQDQQQLGKKCTFFHIKQNMFATLLLQVITQNKIQIHVNFNLPWFITWQKNIS